MDNRFKLFLFFAIATCFALPTAVLGQVDFEADIKPIFENHCIACHGEDDAKDFRIDDKDDTLGGYVIEQDAESSDLYTVLIEEDDEHKMPPPGSTAKPLTEAQIILVKTWINEGANWPDTLNSEWNQVPLPPADDSQLPFRALGSLHPAVVHLPIGLLLAAGLFAFLSLRGNFVMSDCAYYCLWLGAIGSVAACATGWFFSDMSGYGTVDELADVLDQDNAMFWHRITGIAATVFAVILALFAANSRNKDPDDGLMWKLALILLACAIGFVGHKGGELTHGEDHYADVFALYESLFPSNQREDGDRTIDESDPMDEEESEGENSILQPLGT